MTSPINHFPDSLPDKLQETLKQAGKLYTHVRQGYMLPDEFLENCINDLRLSPTQAKQLLALLTENDIDDRPLNDILAGIEKRFQTLQAKLKGG